MKTRCFLIIFIISILLGAGVYASAQYEPVALPESYKNADSDEFISGVESLIESKFLQIRADYGLSAAENSDILQKDAEYLAASLLINGEADPSGLAYVSGWTYVLSEGFTATDKEVSATFFVKTVLNTGKKFSEFRKNYALQGLAVASVQRDGKTVICMVYVGATDSGAVTEEADLIPTAWAQTGDASPEVSQEYPVLIKTGTEITDEAIFAGLIFSGDSSELTLSYDITLVDINTVGSYNFPVMITDSSENQTLFYVDVRVDDDEPYISGDELRLPAIPEGQLWNVAFYVPAGTDWGPVTVVTDIIYLKSGGNLPETVDVTVINGFGNSVSRTLTVVVDETVYGTFASISAGDEELFVKTSKGATPTEGGHVLLEATYEEGRVYNFTIKDPQGNTVQHTSYSPCLVWNPSETGTYTVTLGLCSVEVTVEKSEGIVYNKPELTFDAETGITVENGIIVGIKAETTLAALSEQAILTGGTGTLELSVPEGDGETVLRTGITVTLLENGTECASFTVSVTGDINCDGKVGIGDFAKMRQYLLGNIELDEILQLAGDLNGDGKVGIGDFAKLRQFLLGNLEL